MLRSEGRRSCITAGDALRRKATRAPAAPARGPCACVRARKPPRPTQREANPLLLNSTLSSSTKTTALSPLVRPFSPSSPECIQAEAGERQRRALPPSRFLPFILGRALRRRHLPAREACYPLPCTAASTLPLRHRLRSRDLAHLLTRTTMYRDLAALLTHRIVRKLFFLFGTNR